MTDMPDTMNAAALDRFGGSDQLTLQSVPVPSLDDDQILVRVDTAGVGVWDPIEREGRMKEWVDWDPEFPYVLGSDGAGTVVATGDEVSRFDQGDDVYGTAFLSPKGGFYAEYAAVDEEHASPVPDGLSLEEAGALPIDAVTAYRGLRDELDLEEGDAVLVFGAGGGVGHLALQLANRMGARVLAMTSQADGVDLANDLGASEAVESGEDDPREAIERLAPNGLDAALITATGEGLDAALEGLRSGARMAWPNGVMPEPEAPRGVEGSSYDGLPDREILDDLNRVIGSGPFTVHVAETFPLREAGRAHESLEDHYLGKLALDVDG